MAWLLLSAALVVAPGDLPDVEADAEVGEQEAEAEAEAEAEPEPEPEPEVTSSPATAPVQRPSAKKPPPPVVAEREQEQEQEREQEQEQDSQAEPLSESAKDKPDLPHKGIILDARFGVMGCTRALCKRHKAKPGFRIDGFFGGNIKGFVDIGLNGGWAAFKANVEPGTDGLSLYGLDVDALGPEAMLIDLSMFTVDKARLDTVQVGLDIRVHFIPRGRFAAYAGTGIGYNQFRARYDTPGGLTKLAWHGFYVPLQAGFGVHVHKNIAVGVQFDWLFTWYGFATIRGAPGNLGAPLSLIKGPAKEMGVDLPGDLPMFWTVGAFIRARFGGK